MPINQDVRSLTPYDEQAVDLRIYHNGDETEVTMYPEDGRWYEGDIIRGPEPYGWGGKTYRGDMTNVLRWLEQDYGDYDILDTYMWYG